MYGRGPISRRRMLRMTAGVTVGVALPAVGLAGCSEGTSTTTEPTETPDLGGPTDSGSSVTGMPLPIPERLSGSLLNLEMRTGGREFLRDRMTPTKGYNGDFLGPTLVLRSGSDVSLNVTNNIGVLTTTHWHGFHVPELPVVLGVLTSPAHV